MQIKLAEQIDLETLLQNDKDAMNQKLQAFDSAWFDFEKSICTSKLRIILVLLSILSRLSNIAKSYSEC